MDDKLDDRRVEQFINEQLSVIIQTGGSKIISEMYGNYAELVKFVIFPQWRCIMGWLSAKEWTGDYSSVGRKTFLFVMCSSWTADYSWKRSVCTNWCINWKVFRLNFVVLRMNFNFLFDYRLAGVFIHVD